MVSVGEERAGHSIGIDKYLPGMPGHGPLISDKWCYCGECLLYEQ